MSVFAIDWEKYRLVDLSYEVVPGAQAGFFDIKREPLADGTVMYHVSTHTHAGTHVRVDAHVFPEGRDVTGYGLTEFMGRALLLDVRDATRHRDIDDEYLDRTLGRLARSDDIVICRNSDAESIAGRRPPPRLTPEAADWFVEHGVKMVGLDARFGLGRDADGRRMFHEILIGAGGTIVEPLANLAALGRDVFYFMALPIKVRTVDSAWARAVAIEDV